MNGDGQDMSDDAREGSGVGQPEASPPPGEVHLGPPGESPKTRRTRLGLLIGALIGLIVIGGGAAAAVLLSLRGTGDTILNKIPSDSIVYATAYLDPAAGQKLNLENLLGKFPALDKDLLGEQFSGFMDDALANMGLSFEKDVKPWLGTQVSFVVTGGSEPGPALLIASKDDDAAKTALEQVRSSIPGVTWKDEAYKGETVSVERQDTGFGYGSAGAYSLVDGTVVLAGNARAIEAIIDAAKGDTGNLADNSDYADTMAKLPKERLAEAFVNGPALAALVKRGADLGSVPMAGPDPMASLEAIRGIGVSVNAESNGIAMKMAGLVDSSKLPEGTGGGVKPHQNGILAWTPPDTYALSGGVGLGEKLQQILDAIEQVVPDVRGQLDQFGAVEAIASLSGDFGGVVTPGSGVFPSGAMLLATDDEIAMQTFLDKVSLLVSDAVASDMVSSSGHGQMTAEVPTQSIKQTMRVPSWTAEDYEGVAISYLPLPDKQATQAGIAPAYAVSDGMAIVAASPDEIKKLMGAHAGENITSSANYKAAIARAAAENTAVMYVDLENIFNGIGAAADPPVSDVLSQFEPLKAIVITGGGTSESSTATIFILIE